MAVVKVTALPAATPITTDIAMFVDDPLGTELSAQCTISQLVPALSVDSGKLASNAVTTAKITDANVTYAKIQDVTAASRLLGRGSSGGSGDVEELTLGTNLALSGTTLNTVGGTASGVQNGYRLSLTTAVPVTTADVASAGTIYWVPYKGKSCPLYTGAGWIEYVGGQLSLSLTGLLTSGSVYDVFVNYNSGSPVLTVLVWTDATTRATALAYQDGWLVKSGTPTQFYVGTIRASGTDTTEDSGGGVTTQVGGKRYVWNYYNRVRRQSGVIDTTDSWASTNATRQADGNAGNQVDVVIGVSEDAIEVKVNVECAAQATTIMTPGIGIDSTTVKSGLSSGVSVQSNRFSVSACYTGLIGIGHHYVAWLETGNTTSGVWYGDAGTTRSQSGLTMTHWA